MFTPVHTASKQPSWETAQPWGEGEGLACPLPHPPSLPPPVSVWPNSPCYPSPFRQVQLF